MSKLEFLIIDPQKDFCDKTGSLFVVGAVEDSNRLAKTIKRLKSKIDDIHVTLDTHHYVDIAHPIFWIDSKGNHPNPFTLIFQNDIKNGVWRTTNPLYMKRATDYIDTLATNKRYVLCIWPPHCLIGSLGHNVTDSVYDALIDWEKEFAMVDYVTKGSNFWTEHYSAVQADVPDSQDPGTMLNTRLIQTLQNADVIALSGQALSHCVANTVRDIANNFGEENIKKMVLLIDTTSPVGDLPGSTMFKDMADGFVKEMTKRGMQISKCDDFLK